jgi:3-deoxy-7-phosphoheptulonate synthase
LLSAPILLKIQREFMILEIEEKSDLEALKKRLEAMGFQISCHGPGRLAIVRGVDDLVRPELFSVLPGVKRVILVKEKQKLTSLHSHPQKTVIEIGDVKIGGDRPFVIAGPCSIESEEQIFECARIAFLEGAQGLRGGAFKPRTSPYEFQGMGVEGIKLLAAAGKKYGLVTVTEVIDMATIQQAAPYIDILQVGTRNMHNFELLKELGKVKNPILLKRGFEATYQDLLHAAEYIISGGNSSVILCERGIRTFETYTRNTLDLNAIPALKELTHLPIIADPSHGTGRRSLVAPMAKASIAAGADGLILEIHPQPDRAFTDAQQTIGFEAFAQLMKEIKALSSALKNEP